MAVLAITNLAQCRYAQLRSRGQTHGPPAVAVDKGRSVDVSHHPNSPATITPGGKRVELVQDGREQVVRSPNHATITPHLGLQTEFYRHGGVVIPKPDR